MERRFGGCLCGAVRYAVSAPPNHVVICFCRYCQAATGSDHMVEPLFNTDELEIVEGTPAQYAHVSKGSGKRIFISFCNTCGTKLFQTFERFGDSVGVFAGTFDDPTWFNRTPENTDYYFVDEAPRGAMVAAGFPTFSEHGLTLDGTARNPEMFDQHVVLTDEGEWRSEKT